MEEEKGALTHESLAILAEQFDLPHDVLQTLSIEIGNSLDVESLANIAVVERGPAIARANKVLEVAAKKAKRAAQDLADMERRLSRFSDKFASTKEQRDALATARQRTEAARTAASGLDDAIVCLIELPGSAAVLSPADERRISDGRRRLVVETCCYAWRDAGRSVTYTYKAKPEGIKDQRCGPLIDFIQTVVGLITDPQSTLSGETIRKDIDRWREEQVAQLDQVSIPPR
jgi:hypothetical protein